MFSHKCMLHGVDLTSAMPEAEKCDKCNLGLVIKIVILRLCRCIVHLNMVTRCILISCVWMYQGLTSILARAFIHVMQIGPGHTKALLHSKCLMSHINVP